MRERGYAMVILLVGMAVAAVLASAAMPVWRQFSQREKEAELVFRGNQYVRAIRLFSQRAGPGVMPPSLDVLITQKFLRKKFKDPITGLDFDLLGPSQAAGAPGGRGTPAPGGRGTPSQQAPGARGATPTSSPTATPRTGTGAGTIISGPGAAGGGIIGVASKSKETSIRLYNGRTRYNEWPFIYVQQTQQPGAATPGPPGQRGGQPGRGGSPGRGGPAPAGPPPGNQSRPLLGPPTGGGPASPRR